MTPGLLVVEPHYRWDSKTTRRMRLLSIACSVLAFRHPTSLRLHRLVSQQVSRGQASSSFLRILSRLLLSSACLWIPVVELTFSIHRLTFSALYSLLSLLVSRHEFSLLLLSLDLPRFCSGLVSILCRGPCLNGTLFWIRPKLGWNRTNHFSLGTSFQSLPSDLSQRWGEVNMP